MKEFAWGMPVPLGWTIVAAWGDGWALRKGGLRVLVDCGLKADGNLWLHVSYSRAHWTPSHADSAEVKAAFLGDRYAYAVFPPAEKYVNIHPFCLHLWARLDGVGVLPEFSEFLPELGQRSI